MQPASLILVGSNAVFRTIFLKTWRSCGTCGTSSPTRRSPFCHLLGVPRPIKLNIVKYLIFHRLFFALSLLCCIFASKHKYIKSMIKQYQINLDRLELTYTTSDEVRTYLSDKNVEKYQLEDVTLIREQSRLYENEFSIIVQDYDKEQGVFDCCLGHLHFERNRLIYRVFQIEKTTFEIFFFSIQIICVSLHRLSADRKTERKRVFSIPLSVKLGHFHEGIKSE